MISPDFSPGPAFGGGILIGIAASLLMLLNGRVAGISGIVAQALTPRRGDFAWRLAFLAGLVAGGTMAIAAGVGVPARAASSTMALVIAGLLVGLGTAYGGGCTSGHGVCGIARGSQRSIVATLVFMGAGFATVYVVRHLL